MLYYIRVCAHQVCVCACVAQFTFLYKRIVYKTYNHEDFARIHSSSTLYFLHGYHRPRARTTTHMYREMFIILHSEPCVCECESEQTLFYIYSYAAILSLRIGECVRRRRLFETKAKRKAKRYKHSSNNIKIGLKGVSTSVYMAYMPCSCMCAIRYCGGGVVELIQCFMNTAYKCF